MLITVRQGLNKDLKAKLRHLSRNNTRHLRQRAKMLREVAGGLEQVHREYIGLCPHPHACSCV